MHDHCYWPILINVTQGKVTILMVFALHACHIYEVAACYNGNVFVEKVEFAKSCCLADLTASAVHTD